MITLTQVRELNLTVATGPGRPLHLSAASGLVNAGDFRYVIADDEFHLGIFTTENEAPGQLLPLFPGQLPDDKKARKKLKPDLEALTYLPPFHGFPTGAGFRFQAQPPDGRSVVPECRGRSEWNAQTL